MCEAKPGCRCATDTRGAATATLERYADAHPGGPAVDPLTAAAVSNQPAHPPAALERYEQRRVDAQPELAAAEAAHQESTAAVAQMRAERLTFADRARDIRNQIDPHEYAAKEHARTALQRAGELYREHGANPRLVGYYVSDMREAAGLAPAGYDPNRRSDSRSQFLTGRDLAMKVKRNGPDAAPTRAAAAAAKNDPEYAEAVEKFNAEKQAALALEAQAQAVEAAMHKSDPEFYEAVRREGVTQERLALARKAAADAQDGLERARVRAAAGVPVEGQTKKVDNTLRNDIYVAADGATNLWQYRPAMQGAPARYERLYARTSEHSGNTHLVTADGRKVRRTTHYANYRSTTSTPEVWVGQPAPEARPVGEVYERVSLESSIDSGD